MIANSADYPNNEPTQDVKLGALGYDGTGHRGGGILQPQYKTLPVGTVLLRLYKPIEKTGEHPGDFGAWWFTPHEYHRICDYFGVDGRALVAGRSKGASALHGVLALLKEWYGGSGKQLSFVNAVRVTVPIMAGYGPGAPANAAGYTRTLKPVRMKDGQPARQVYIHTCYNYQSAFTRLLAPGALTDTVFGGAPGSLPGFISGTGRQAFEV